MIKESTKKSHEVQLILSELEPNQLVPLGFMAMARTLKLIDTIASHEGFHVLGNFNQLILGGLKKWLYSDLSVKVEAENALNICNSLIETLESYDYSDCIDKYNEDIMGIAYAIVEDWYYFIELIYEDINSSKISRFLTTPITAIDSYLCNKYSDLRKYSEIQKKVNDDELLKREIGLIDADISFIKSKHINDDDIRERIINYTLYQLIF